MASTSRLTMQGAGGGLGASMSAGGAGPAAAANLSIAEQLMQLDQAITLTLQDIDANLSAAHQTVTSKLLPAVKRYGVASARTWQGAKFWMKFFEAAADVSLSGTSGLRHGDEHGAPDVTESDLLHDGDDVTQSQFADEYYDDEDEYEDERAAAAPPKKHTTAAEAVEDEEGDEFDDSLEITRLRDAMPVSSHSRFDQGQGATSDRNAARSNRISTTPRAQPRRPQIASDVPYPRELGSTTPNDKPLSASVRVLNAEASARRWDGIADLRSTPLNARGKRFGARLGTATGSKRLSASPRKGKGAADQLPSRSVPRTVQEWSDEEDEDGDEDEEGDSLPPLLGMSPPQTMQFSVPRSRYMNTPAKEAARLMVDDVLRTIDGIADPLGLAARTRQERAAAASSASTSARPQHLSVVGTPLRKDKSKTKHGGKNRGRDSLPTPPTLTKLPPRPLASYIAEQKSASAAGHQPSTTPLAAPGTTRAGVGSAGSAMSGGNVPGSIGTRSNAGRVMDEGEDEGAAGFDFSELQARKGGAGGADVLGSGGKDRVDSLLNVEDEDSDSPSDSDSDDDALVGTNVLPAYPATASKSSWTIGSAQASSGGSRTNGSRQGRSIEDDTLFGVRAPLSASTAAAGGAGGSGLRTTAGPMQNPFAKPAGGAGSRGSGSNAPAMPSYKPVDSTVHGGRSLIGTDRSDTYSAPSPTPYGGPSHK